MNTIQKEAFNILVEFDRICRENNLNYSLAFGTLLGAVRHQGFIPWDDDVDVTMLRKDYEAFQEIVSKQCKSEYFFTNHEVEKNNYYSFGKIRSNTIDLPEISTNWLNIHQGVWIDIFPLDNVPDIEADALKQKNAVKKLHTKFVYHLFASPLPSDSMVKKTIKTLFKFKNQTLKLGSSSHEKWYQEIEHNVQFYNNQPCESCTLLSSNFTENEYEGMKRPLIFFETLTELEFEGKMFKACKDYDTLLTGIYGDYMCLPPESERISNHHYVK